MAAVPSADCRKGQGLGDGTAGRLEASGAPHS